MTQEEVLAIIDKITSNLAYKFTFGYHTYDDIKQQGFIEACKGLEKYDGSHPLENFLWIHIKNRLCNLKRKQLERLDKPCFKCPLKAYIKDGDICEAYVNKDDCELYRNWMNRNGAKRNLMNTIDIDNIDTTSEQKFVEFNDITDDIEQDRILHLIDEKLPIALRPAYLKMRAGVKLPKSLREELRIELAIIMEENGINV